MPFEVEELSAPDACAEFTWALCIAESPVYRLRYVHLSPERGDVIDATCEGMRVIVPTEVAASWAKTLIEAAEGTGPEPPPLSEEQRLVWAHLGAALLKALTEGEAHFAPKH